MITKFETKNKNLRKKFQNGENSNPHCAHLRGFFLWFFQKIMKFETKNKILKKKLQNGENSNPHCARLRSCTSSSA